MTKAQAIERLTLRKNYYHKLYIGAAEDGNEEDRQYFLGKTNGIDEAIRIVMQIEFEDWTSDNRNEDLR